MKINVLGCIFFVWAMILSGADKIVYPVSYSSVSPRLDGLIENDSAWAQVPWSTEFILLRKQAAPRAATRFKAVYCTDALYLAAECREKDMSKLKPVYNFTEFWKYDCLEAFFHLGRNELLHLAMNPDGMKADEIPGITARRTGFRTGWLGTAFKNERSWTVELCIPFHLLGKAPSRQNELEISYNLCRYSTPENEWSTWSFQTGPFNNTRCFGILRFEPPPVQVEKTIQSALTIPHYSSLIRRYDEIRNSKKFTAVLKKLSAERKEIEQILATPGRPGKEFPRLSQLIRKIEEQVLSQEEEELAEVINILFGD